ncbi:MAG: hypothetical protein HC795_06635 [Coleofasciculaceae cyanobacterium RL_1_1]|nr:hypothetical protein [Coleofasciculaceae cyanobacterium RL_1_1]
MAAFFFPEVYRKGDFIWSGVGIFYAIVLWFCAGQATGAELLGETASVALIFSLGGQLLALRRQKTPSNQQTSTEAIDTAKKKGGLFGGFGKKTKPTTESPTASDSPEQSEQSEQSDSPNPAEPEAGIIADEPLTVPDVDLIAADTEVTDTASDEVTADPATSEREDAGDENTEDENAEDENVTDQTVVTEASEITQEEPIADPEDNVSVDLGESETPDKEANPEPSPEPIPESGVKATKSGGILGSIGALFGRKSQASDAAIAELESDPLEDWDEDDSDDSTELESNQPEVSDSEPSDAISIGDEGSDELTSIESEPEPESEPESEVKASDEVLDPEIGAIETETIEATDSEPPLQG